MSSVANRRELVEAAQALAKTNKPTGDHYGRLAKAFEDVIHDDCGVRFQVLLHPPKVSK